MRILFCPLLNLNGAIVDEICRSSIFYCDGSAKSSSHFNLVREGPWNQLKTVSQHVGYLIVTSFRF